MKTPYEILGVRRFADGNAIRAALRRAAKTYHPDINPNDPKGEQRLKEAIGAYELLMDPAKRAAYDGHLRHRRQQKARRLLVTALASAGVASGATLAAAIWLARPPEVSVPAPEPSHAAVGPARDASEKVADSKEVVDRDSDQVSPAVSTPSSLGHEWEQVAQTGDPLEIQAFIVRNPEAPEAELARSQLMLLIDASDDAAVLNTLLNASGAVAERAQQRLARLRAPATIKEHAAAVIAASDAEPSGTTVLQNAASYLERARERLGKADFDGAIADFDAAIDLEPGNALARSQRASAWGGKGDRERALADFELAIQADPGNPAIFRDRAIYWRRSGALDLALVDFDHAIRLGFSDARAYNERGLVWREKGRYERAIADFTQAIKIDPKLADAYINRSIALGAKGDAAGSAADMNQATRIKSALLPSDDLTPGGK
jgi:tetratricopeptide (TPR) repeat protein